MAELTRRYIVMPLATEGPFDPGDPENAFVLKPWKDPAALRALEVYRAHCYPELARELGEWIARIRSGPVLRGGVGARNEAHAAARPIAKPRSRRAPTIKVTAKTRPSKPMKKKGKR
ncbi:MAG TPA: hypothetical protein VML54_00780 [Candidatus Limnocylindrales bacterium]|nr:hypothetical protein [Candidatus Limnocylindrales bacterium]